jgi:phospholipid-binding lipoprotein MlaA
MVKFRFHILALTALLCFAAPVSAQAQAAPEDQEYASADDIADPFIGFNRAVFAINDGADQVLIRPIAKGYQYVVPQPIRTGLRNFLRNLRAPVNLANELLQGNLMGAGTVLTRTAINTFVGLGGTVDVAAMEGIPYNQEDFGQTLAVWGVGHGSYMVIPILGASSVRDGTGLLVDSLMDPLNWYLRNTDENGWLFARFAAEGLVKRESLLDALDDLRKNSFDYYVAVRSSYVQYRAAEVAKRTGRDAAPTEHP